MLGLAIWSAAVVLFFAAGAMFVAASISGPPGWVRALLVSGGVVLVFAAGVTARPGFRRIRFAGSPPPSVSLSADERDAQRLIRSAFPETRPSREVRWARLVGVPPSEPALLRRYTLAIAGPLAALAVLLGEGVWAVIRWATGESGTSPAQLLSAALPAVLVCQFVALVGAGLAIAALRPEVARLRLLGTFGIRFRLYATIVVSAGLGVWAVADGHPSAAVAVVAVVGAVSVLVVVAVDLVAGLAGRRSATPQR